MTIKRNAKLIRKKKEDLRYWQGQARMETRWLRETTQKCNELEREIYDLENQTGRHKPEDQPPVP